MEYVFRGGDHATTHQNTHQGGHDQRKQQRERLSGYAKAQTERRRFVGWHDHKAHQYFA